MNAALKSPNLTLIQDLKKQKQKTNRLFKFEMVFNHHMLNGTAELKQHCW